MHAWLAIQGRCNTADQLAKKNWPHTPICTLCQLQPETALHLFAQCQFTRLLWQMISQRFQVQISLPSGDDSSLEDWWSSSVRSLSKKERMKINCLFICTWWHVWKERHARIFEQRASALTEVSSLIREELRLWCTAGLVGAMWMPPD